KEHYKEFDELYGQLTSEKYRLLHQEILNEESQVALGEEDSQTVVQYFENISYSCGSPILPDSHPLFNQLHIHQNITCDSPIERNYYSSRLKDVDLCYWCGAEDGIIDPSDELKSEFKTIYPLCASCYANGHEWSTCAPIVFQANKKVRT
ncbi:12691_t:CDS:2, partial [Ambispora leptoticha]